MTRDQGWAVASQGTTVQEGQHRAIEAHLLCALMNMTSGRIRLEIKGFCKEWLIYKQELQTPYHCNRLILSGVNVVIQMENFFMYRC